VAFFAWLTTEQTNLPVGHTVQYDGVGNNYGDGYDKNTGIFTCPTTGLYLLAFFAEAYKERQVVVLELKINGVSHLGLLAEPSFEYQDIMGGNVIPLRLTKGDRVWVEVVEHVASLWKVVTNFSGVLIHR